jgi:hypothetical protein
MKSSDVSFYFVLYLVAVMTVFAITVERDRTLAQRNEVIAHLIEVYVRPLKLSPSVDTTRLFTGSVKPMMNDSVRIRFRTEGPITKNDIAFQLVASTLERPDGSQSEPLAGYVMNDNGDGVLVYPPVEEGVYTFKVTGHKDRIKIDGKKMKVNIADVWYDIPYADRMLKIDNDTTVLTLKVARSGAEEQQLTLSVSEARDSWVVGPPFIKKIFVGGIESLDGVSFDVSPAGRVEKSTGPESYVTFTWDAPKAGDHTFSVSANGSRNVGSRDKASISFVVSVQPPTFVSHPMEKGFWGIPYHFDGQIVGINPLDCSVEEYHDGQKIDTQPVVPEIVLTPSRDWSNLSFKILYKNSPIKEHKVALSSPPPPQIKWVQQRLDHDKGLFQITLNAADAAGGPVRISLQSQPSGLATLDKIRGTSFTISVDLKSRPSSIYLRVTASDQYGGQNTSSKQYNIPQQ